MFLLAKPADGLFVRRVHHQMKATQALYADDHAAFERSGRCRDGIFRSAADVAVAVPQFQTRPTVTTSVRLGMKSTVERVFVFRATAFTHCELAHRCVRAIVRQVLDNRKARAAMRA